MTAAATNALEYDADLAQAGDARLCQYRQPAGIEAGVHGTLLSHSLFIKVL
jgi:hypothetical protein